MPALVAWRHNPLVREFCERLKTKGKNGKAAACAAMRKLLPGDGYDGEALGQAQNGGCGGTGEHGGSCRL